MSSSVTSSLRSILNNSNKQESDKIQGGDVEMTEVKKSNKLTAAKEAAAKEAEAKTTQETKPADETTATNKKPIQETKPAEGAEGVSEIDALLQQAEQQQQEQQQSKNSAGTTDLFDKGKGKTEDTTGKELTEEEKKKAAEEEAKKAEKARKALERENATKAYNEAMTKHHSKLKSEAGDTQLTNKQIAFRTACQANFVCEALLVENGPEPVIDISRKWKVNKGKPVLLPGVQESQYSAWKTKATKDKQGNLQDYTTSLRYVMKRPSKIVGAVITMPQALNITVDQFKTDQFELPTREQIDASPRMVAVVDFETLFMYTNVYCGGRIKEASHLKDGKFLGASRGEFWFESSFVVQTKKDEKGLPYTHEAKSFVSASRGSNIFVQENIIPVKLTKTMPMSQLANDPATKEAIVEKLKKKLDKPKEETFALAQKLEQTSAALINFELNDSSNVVRASFAFLEGKAVLGQGAAEAFALRHWSNSHKNAAGKKEMSLIPQNYVPLYTANPKKDDPSQMTYKKVVDVLGDDYTLDQIAEEYPAAGVVKALGVSESAILEKYDAYKEHAKRLAAEKAAASNKKPKTTKRVDNHVDAAVSTALLLRELQGNATGYLGDAAAVNQSIYNIAYGATPVAQQK